VYWFVDAETGKSHGVREEGATCADLETTQCALGTYQQQRRATIAERMADLLPKQTMFKASVTKTKR